MNKLKKFLFTFSRGRYGNDALNKFLLWSYAILAVINVFFKSIVISGFYTALAGILIYRMLSRDIYKRQRENTWYLNARGKLMQGIKYFINKWKLRKTHIYRKCPSCKAKIRLPGKKGRHICCCPVCKKDFEVKCR